MVGKNKAVKNAFFFYTLDYKAKAPRRFDTFHEYTQAAGPSWSQMNAEERRPYEEKARREKNQTKVVKYTTTGVNIEVIERREQEKDAKNQKMKDDIENMIHVAVNTETIADEWFYFIHINFFCQYTNNKNYVPAEIAVARFTLRDGVLAENVYHAIIEPGPLQMGYSSTAKEISESTHKLTPPTSLDEVKDNQASILASLKAFMKEMHPTGRLPPVYAEAKNMPVVENVLETLIYEYGDSHETFKLRVYALDYFFYTLRNAVGSINGKQVWPQLSNSILQLEKDVYDFCTDVACSIHELSDAPNHCSRSHVMRFAYLICDHCCGDLGIELIPGKHVPKRANVVPTRPSSRASSVASSYRTARSNARQSTLREEDYYMSTTESVFSETSTLVDPDDLPEIASLSLNESAYTDEDSWQKPKQRHNKHKKHDSSPMQSDYSQDSNPSYHSQPTENKSRRPNTLSAALAGRPMPGVSSGIRSMVGRGRGRGFTDQA